MRNISLSKYLSKSVHLFTIFVYLFTFLGPSLALASHAPTYAETVNGESEKPRAKTTPSTPPKSAFTGKSHTFDDLPSALQDTYHRFTLKVSQDPLSGGIHFRLRDFEGTRNLFHHVLPNDKKDSPFTPLLEDGTHTGFTVDVPDVGQIQCDWQGNLKLVGLHRISPETAPLALLLATDGSVDFSDITFKNLALHAKNVTFVQGIKIQEESVFDIDVLDLAESGFENTKLMSFLSKTRFISKKRWRNKGKIVGEKSLDFDRCMFSNPGIVYGKDHLTLSSGFFDNDGGAFHGEKGTSLNLTRYFYNKRGGKVSSGKVTHVHFHKKQEGDLGDIHGEEVVLEDLSGGFHFSLQKGRVEATHSTTLIGKHPSTKGVDFVTPQLILDAPDFSLGKQKHVERTVVKRSKGQFFTLTSPYKTAGTLEFWQKDLTTRKAVQAAMLARFGDEKGKMPAPHGKISLQSSVKAAGGLKFFTPHAKVSLGDETKEALLEFFHKQGWLEAYATEFDLEKGTLVAENAYIHAPGSIKMGRLVKDENEDLFSQKLYKKNGSTVLVRGTTTLRGPWHHRADFLTSFLILNSPKDHLFEAGSARVLKDCTLKGGGDLDLMRKRTEIFILRPNLSSGHGTRERLISFISGAPAEFLVGNYFNNDGQVNNHSSIMHAYNVKEAHKIKNIDIEACNTNLNSQHIKYQFNYFNSYFPISFKEMVTDPFHNFKGFSFKQSRGLDQYIGSGLFSGMMLGVFAALQEGLNGNGAVTYPAQTSFGEGVTVSPNEEGKTTLGGNFQAPATIVLIPTGSAEIGTRPSATLQKVHTHSPLQSLVPEAFNLHTLTMAEHLRDLMAEQPEVETFFKFHPRFWFEADKAQQFHNKLRPYVRAQRPQGGFYTPEGQVLFTISPDMLISQVQDQALKVFGRGTIEDNRKIDEEQILELHQNFVNYLKELEEVYDPETGKKITLPVGPLSLASLGQHNSRPAPKKPCIAYAAAMNEEGILELSPMIWMPKKMHAKHGITTQLLLSIPQGMRFKDFLAYAMRNPLLAAGTEKLITDHPHMISQLDEAAERYRDENKISEDDELPKAGPVTFEGDIDAKTFMGFNTGDVISHADITAEDASLVSLFGSVIMSSLVGREGSGDHFHDKIVAQARIKADKLINIFAGQDIIFQGAETISEVSTHILALANLIDVPAVLISQRTQQLSGKYKGSETWIHVHNHVSKHSSGGEYDQQTLGAQDLHGVEYDAGKLKITGKGKVNFAAVFEQLIHSSQGTKKSRFKTKNRQETTSTSTSKGGVIGSRDAAAEITSEDSDLIFEAIAFKGKYGAIIKALKGRVEFLLGHNTKNVSSMSSSSDPMWMKSTQKTEEHLTFTIPTTEGPIKVHSLETLLQSVDGQHLAFLDDLDLTEGGSLISQVIKEIHESHSKTVQGPGMALAVIVAVVVTCCTGGAGGPIAGALANALGGFMSAALAQALSVAFVAALDTALTNLTLDTMSNGGNVGKGLKQMGSKKNLKAMGTAALKSGGGKANTAIGAVGEKIVQSAMNAGIDTAINGGKFGKHFTTNLKYAGASLFVDGVIDEVSGSASNDNKAQQGPPLDFGERAQEFIGSAALNVGRQFAVNSLAGEDPKDAFIKAAAAFAAHVACFGIASGFDGLKGFFANDNDAEDNHKSRGASSSEGRPQTPEERAQEERERRDQSLHDIIDGIDYEEESTREGDGPRKGKTRQDGKTKPSSTRPTKGDDIPFDFSFATSQSVWDGIVDEEEKIQDDSGISYRFSGEKRGRSSERVETSSRSRSYSPPRIKDTYYEEGTDWFSLKVRSAYEAKERISIENFDPNDLLPAFGALSIDGVILVNDGLDKVTLGGWSTVTEFLDKVANGARTYTRRGSRFVSGDQRSAQNLGDGVYVVLSVVGGKGLKSIKLFKKMGNAVKNLRKAKTAEAARFWDKKPINFKGNKIFQRDDLIRPDFLTGTKGLTNLDRMKLGRAPLSLDGNPINLVSDSGSPP